MARSTTTERAFFTLDWYRTLAPPGRRAFWASFVGYGLAAFDLLTFTFVLSSVRADFDLSTGQVGFLATSSLVASAFGGVLGGALADGIGRVRTMMLAIGIYAVATLLCGLAQGYEQLLLWRVLLGVGFGGEWTASALLTAEYAEPAHRGRLLGMLASAFAVGDALATVAYAVVAHLAAPDLAWRILFGLGALPALLLLYIRAGVSESPVDVATRSARAAVSGVKNRLAVAGRAFGQIFGRDLLATTVTATALASGAISGRYVVSIWLPTYLRTERDLGATASSAEMTPVLAGSWLGYIVGGYCQDLLGRRRTFALYSVASAIVLWLYVRVPTGEGALLAMAGVALGFFTSGALSGLGAYLSELFPSRARGIGQGFSYNVGRAVAAIPVALVGDLATGVGIGRAIAGSAIVYALCLVALRFLPETRGQALTDAPPAR